MKKTIDHANPDRIEKINKLPLIRVSTKQKKSKTLSLKQRIMLKAHHQNKIMDEDSDLEHIGYIRRDHRLVSVGRSKSMPIGSMTTYAALGISNKAYSGASSILHVGGSKSSLSRSSSGAGSPAALIHKSPNNRFRRQRWSHGKHFYSLDEDRACTLVGHKLAASWMP